jgi:hypothetical protein
LQKLHESGLRRQRKNFNQRVSYWVKQWVSFDEASRLALVREQMVVSSSAPLETSSNSRPVSNTPPQALGQLYNFPQVNLKPALARKSDAQEIRIKLPVEPAVDQSFKIRPTEILEQIFCLLMVIGTSVILIKASWQVFGPGWEGFLKAFLLEAGILTLSVYRGRKILSLMVSRAGAIALACLSLFVLHTGVEGAQAEALKSAVEADAELTALEAQRDRLLTLQDDLPPDHLKRREVLLGSVNNLTDKIEKAKTQISAGQTTKTIKNQHTLETLIRIALMFIGTVFTHHLVSRIKEFNFGGVRGHQALLME